MKNFIGTILLLSTIILAQSCGKDTNEFVPTSTTTISFQDTVWEDESKIQSLVTPLSIEKLATQLVKPPVNDSSVTAETGGKIVTPEDVTVDVPANACVTKNNQPCKGKLDIDIVFLRTKGELIAYDKPTTSGGKILVSGGVVYISVKQKGEDVKLANNKTIKIRIKSLLPLDESMRLFEGKSMDRFKFDWSQINGSNTANNVSLWTSDSTRTKGYEFLTDRFGWINIDKFATETNLTTKFAVTFADSFTNRNTSVFLVFKDINSVVKLEGNSDSRQFGIPNNYKGIPIGKSVIVVSISNFESRSSTFSMLDAQEVTVAASNTIKLKPIRYTADEIKKRISAF